MKDIFFFDHYTITLASYFYGKQVFKDYNDCYSVQFNQITPTFRPKDD